MKSNLFLNPHKNQGNKLLLKMSLDAIEFHRSIRNYTPTPLIQYSDDSSKTSNIVFVKDESERFGLNSFKALGPYYAIYKHIANRWNKVFSVPLSLDYLDWDFIFSRFGPQFTFTAASEGNHGKSLAWACTLINQPCIIYIPSTVSAERVQSIKQFGAQIQIVSGTYEETVRRCFKDGQEYRRTIISDMSYEDYQKIPIWIMESYLSIFVETQNQLNAKNINSPDFVFVQAGVGGLAGAAAHFYGQNEFKQTKIICVEPEESNCLMESAKEGKITKTKASMNTIMGCLNCDYPSFVALPTILDKMHSFLTISDNDVKTAMKALYYTKPNKQIIAGESGAASFAGFQKVMNNPQLKKELGINTNSVILCINTEGNNDPVSFEQIINQ